MNVKIHAKQLDIGDSLRTYAERHIAETLANLYKRRAATLDIEFSRDVGGREKVCKVTVFVPRGKTLVASAKDANPYAAVDLVAEKISRELRQYKEKRLDATKAGVSPAALDLTPEQAEDELWDLTEYEEPLPEIIEVAPLN